MNLLDQKEDYIQLKSKVVRTPLEKSIDFIIEKIKQDIEKLTKLNQIEYIY
ncbi:MAG: hypothetical protein ACFFCV_13410 [Promethearchaeota archaeon]